MRFVADLHLHSKYSRAVSPSMTLPVMAQFAQQKGIDILTASDFTHPLWYQEIQTQLEEAGHGLYVLKSEYQNSKFEINSNYQNTKIQKKTRFLLSTEISSIYKQGGRLRRIHSLVFVPSLEVAEKFRQALISRGCNLNADGRPIVGLSAKNLLELLLSIDERSMLIPCHVWTPHFGVYGSASGFDSLEECFEDLAPYVYGIETGISSDPGMNWAVPELRNRSILSFSDAHSAPKMGRELTVFELEEASYENIRRAIMRPSVIASEQSERGNLIKQGIASSQASRNDANKISHTVEFYPEEGKYHFSGHRNCKVAQGPEEIRESGNMCSVCQRRLTEGVLFRVQQLEDEALFGRVEEKLDEQGVKWFTDNFGEQPPFVKLVPLLEIVAQGLGSSVASQKSQKMFAELCLEFGNEMNVLLKTPIEDVARSSNERVAEALQKVRAGDIAITPGYDGEYGKVRIWEGTEETKGTASNAAAAKGPKVSEGQMRLDI